MIHKLCVHCTNPCKQEDTVKIVHCPRFQKRLSDVEFHDLINELETMENDADKLKKRVLELLQTATSPDEFMAHDSETKDLPDSEEN